MRKFLKMLLDFLKAALGVEQKDLAFDKNNPPDLDFLKDFEPEQKQLQPLTGEYLLGVRLKEFIEKEVKGINDIRRYKQATEQEFIPARDYPERFRKRLMAATTALTVLNDNNRSPEADAWIQGQVKLLGYTPEQPERNQDAQQDAQQETEGPVLRPKNAGIDWDNITPFRPAGELPYTPDDEENRRSRKGTEPGMG